MVLHRDPMTSLPGPNGKPTITGTLHHPIKGKGQMEGRLLMGRPPGAPLRNDWPIDFTRMTMCNSCFSLQMIYIYIYIIYIYKCSWIFLDLQSFSISVFTENSRVAPTLPILRPRGDRPGICAWHSKAKMARCHCGLRKNPPFT